ncbi:EamA family transporter RarD [Fodinicurvata sediminis]|uniref:EamA family transporter RarD n=1 Tax=Fodinicurvata sediminis TaxID=1121832 RepID=UPI0003B324DD|nr:EamA family transporter RarD [Fodinicurvata sediminis]
MQDERKQATVGVLYGLAAFSFWGLGPIYFKAVAHVGTFEVMAHRVVWCVLLLAFLVTLVRSWPRILSALHDRRTLLLLAASTILITINWTTFIYGVNAGRVLETSLGYFINPLVTVFLGMIFLGEKLSPWRWISVVLAFIGIGVMAVEVEGLPWISLSLAFSFGFYGLVRKKAPLESFEGLFLETLLISPIALGFLLYLDWEGIGHFLNSNLTTDILLILAGPVTALPLLWFTSAARRVRLSTVGFMQYIAPSVQFLLAVFLFGEVFTDTHLITFGLIWCGLVIYSGESYHARRQRNRPAVT